MLILQQRHPHRSLKWLLVMLLLASLAIGIAWRLLSGDQLSITSANALSINETMLQPFQGNRQLSYPDYDQLELYFQQGLAARISPDGATAHYPGLPSNHSRHTDQIEGFTRMAPLLAVWLSAYPEDSSKRQRQARQLLINGLSSGVDPQSVGYWGNIVDEDQLIVEASDVALTVWLLRDSLWLQLPSQTQRQVTSWLLQVNHKGVPDNNWHLFITFCNLVVASLGGESDSQQAQAHYARFKSFYRGDGWFSDGPADRFDYYNAWGIHYQLFWIDQVAPHFDHSFIAGSLDDFARNLQYLIGPSGIPMLGRSICYRMAIVTPLILDQHLVSPSVPPGVARRALNVTWSYFLKNGGALSGNITQGYCAADPKVLDSYSGPASCLWGLRSLISALYLETSSPLWTASERPLPVEVSNYRINFPQPGWTVVGKTPDLIVVEKPTGVREAPLEDEAPWLVMVDRLRHSVHRPENEVAKYGLKEYRSDRPFCGCKQSSNNLLNKH